MMKPSGCIARVLPELTKTSQTPNLASISTKTLNSGQTNTPER
ncbi:hypothetical protein [Oscillatoria sp. FACHB-1406]|nr:hypothetical protein [Oscillatoria sp. FACHB-1406]